MSVSAPRGVGRYEVLREIGRGGMAIVYLARQTDLDRDVALKELAALHARSPDFLERFLREARLAGSLSHPNIVTVHEYFEDDGTAYIAMEYLERGSLRPFVGHLGTAQIGGVLDGLLAGLAHAERRGVVHRDLKPENVMVTLEGAVKIADFGIAKALAGPNGRSLTGTGATVGTPAYIAPELALGGEVGPSTDLYALGVIAYELLSGNVPFHETEMPLALMLRHANEPVPPLRSVQPDVDPALAAWVERLLRKSPGERPSSALEASEALDEILTAGVGPRWRRDAPLVDGASRDRSRRSGRLGTPATGVLGRATSSRRRRLALAFAAVAVAVLGAAVVAWQSSGDEAPPPAAAPKLPVDLVPPPRDRLALAAAGANLFVTDPAGWVVGLDRRKATATQRLADPARPRSAVLARGSLLVADDEALTALDPRSLVARGSVAVGPGAMLADGHGRDPVIAMERDRGGRICTVAPGPRLGPCTNVPFVVGGLGTSEDGSAVFAADTESGRLITLRRTERALTRVDAPLDVGRAPHGRILERGSSLFVPVTRGVAVVDRRTLSTRTLRLPVTPSDIWVSGSGSNGRLFAALPGIGRVGSVRLDRPEGATLLVAAGARPVALAGAAAPVIYAVSARDGVLTMLDSASGARSGARTITTLDAPSPRRVVLARVRRAATDGLDITLSLTGGTLPASGIVVTDGRVGDGRALLELRQGGITTRVGTRPLGDATVRPTAEAGRLAIGLTVPKGRYAGLRVRRDGAHTVRIRATNVPPPPAPSTSQSGGTSPPATPEPRPRTEPKPKKPAYEVG